MPFMRCMVITRVEQQSQYTSGRSSSSASMKLRRS
jgi:hypothetical protein